MWSLETVLLPLVIFGCVGIGLVYWTNGNSFKGVYETNVDKITAKGKIKWTQITASAWIHGTGAWVLFALPETGWTAGIWGVIAYAIGCGTPGILFANFGHSFAKVTRGHSLVDWVRSRYGRFIYYCLLFLSCFFLFILSCSELTGLIDAYDFLLNSRGDIEAQNIAWIPAAVVIIANTYACIGGLEVSLITDRIEGIFCLVFLCLCLWITTSLMHQTTEPISWEFTPEAGNATITLILGCAINELINQTQWQRVFCSKSSNHLKAGATLGSFLIMLHVITFGMCGVYVSTLYSEGRMPEGFSPDMGGVDSFFWGLFMTKNSAPLISMTLAITCCIVCSTMDTLVNAYSSLLISPLQRRDIKLKWLPLLTLTFTLPAIGVACARLSVIALFMTINVIAVSVVPGVLLGIFKWGSSRYALMITSALGIITVPIYGACLEKTWSGAFGMFLFPRGPYDSNSAILFVICTLISALGTPAIAYAHRKFWPESFEKEWSDYQDIINLPLLSVPSETALKNGAYELTDSVARKSEKTVSLHSSTSMSAEDQYQRVSDAAAA